MTKKTNILHPLRWLKFFFHANLGTLDSFSGGDPDDYSLNDRQDQGYDA